MSTWVARFVVDHGRVTEEGGRLRTFERRRLDEADVDLHVIAEPTGVKGEELAAQALDAIGRLFQQDKLSLTGGIQRALAGTHQTLQEWNRRSLPSDQVSIGVTAALVRGDTVYLAQAGPGLVYVRRSGVLVRHDPGEGAATPLGEGTLEPALRRFELDPGDLILAASTSLGAILNDDTLESLLNRPSDETLPELYLLTRDLPNFALLAITCHESEPDDAAEESTGEPEQVDRPPEYLERSPAPRTASEPAPGAPARPIALGDLKPAVTNGHALEPEPEPPLNLPVAPPPIDISRPVVRLRSDQASSRGEYVRTTGTPRRMNLNFGNTRLLQIGAAIVAVLLVIAFVPDLVQESRSQKLANLIANAQTQFAAAQGETEPGQRRFLLADARRLSSEALRIEPLNGTAAELREQSGALLSEMDAIFDLGPPATVTTLGSAVTGDVSVEAVRVHGGRAYLLDTRGGRIIAAPLDGTPVQVVFQKDQTYGGVIARAPLQFTWEGPDETGRLLVLDEERKLFEVRPGSEPRSLPLRRTGTWSSVGGIATYDANFYVLDPRANQVHRYRPAAEGFDSEPDVILAGQIELEAAVGLAVDGDVYVVLETGQVRRFQNGADAGFGLAGIDRPISAASDIAVVAANAEVFIADSGNKRVVVAGKDGVFRRQLVSSAFTDIRALTVDSAGAQLYVVIGDALLTAAIVR